MGNAMSFYLFYFILLFYFIILPQNELQAE